MWETGHETDVFLARSSRALGALSALDALSLDTLIEETAALNTFVLIALDAVLRAIKGD